MPIAAPSQYETLSAMITPAIFLTANASLIISTSNRMSRVVDRIRVLNDVVDKLDCGKTDLDYLADRLEHLQDQFRRLGWRGDRIRFALIALYIAFATVRGNESDPRDRRLGPEPARRLARRPGDRWRRPAPLRQRQPGAGSARGAAVQPAGNPLLPRAPRAARRRPSRPRGWQRHRSLEIGEVRLFAPLQHISRRDVIIPIALESFFGCPRTKPCGKGETDYDVLEAADAELRGLSQGPAEQADPLRRRPAGDVLAVPGPGLVPVRPPGGPDHGGHDLLPGGRDLLSAAGLVRCADAAPGHTDPPVGLGLGRAACRSAGRSPYS